MGYRTAELPDVDLDEFADIPFFPRMKLLMLHWVEAGFGTPKQTGMFYAWKIFLYALFGLIFAGAFTAGRGFGDIDTIQQQSLPGLTILFWLFTVKKTGSSPTKKILPG